MNTPKVTFKDYYPKWLVIFGILYSIVNFYALLTVPKACQQLVEGRLVAAYEIPSHILSIASLGNIMLTPLSAVRKAPGWRLHFYERGMYYTYGFLGTSVIYDHVFVIKGVLRECVYHNSAYPYPILYPNYLIFIICGVVGICDVIVKTYWNLKFIA